MQNYRISKFYPLKRDANGIYPHEWTAILEPNPENTPNYEEYEKVENRYQTDNWIDLKG